MFAAFADHETGHILKKYQRDLFLITVHDKTGCLVGAVGVDHTTDLHLTCCTPHHVPLIGDDSDAPAVYPRITGDHRSEEHTSELQSRGHLVCRLLLEKQKARRRMAVPGQ